MAWYWWLILIGVLIAVGLLKIVIMKKYNQKKNSNNRPKDTRTIKTNFAKRNCCLHNSRKRQF